MQKIPQEPIYTYCDQQSNRHPLFQKLSTKAFMEQLDRQINLNQGNINVPKDKNQRKIMNYAVCLKMIALLNQQDTSYNQLNPQFNSEQKMSKLQLQNKNQKNKINELQSNMIKLQSVCSQIFNSTERKSFSELIKSLIKRNKYYEDMSKINIDLQCKNAEKEQENQDLRSRLQQNLKKNKQLLQKIQQKNKEKDKEQLQIQKNFNLSLKKIIQSKNSKKSQADLLSEIKNYLIKTKQYEDNLVQLQKTKSQLQQAIRQIQIFNSEIKSLSQQKQMYCLKVNLKNQQIKAEKDYAQAIIKEKKQQIQTAQKNLEDAKRIYQKNLEDAKRMYQKSLEDAKRKHQKSLEDDSRIHQKIKQSIKNIYQKLQKLKYQLRSSNDQQSSQKKQKQVASQSSIHDLINLIEAEYTEKQRKQQNMQQNIKQLNTTISKLTLNNKEVQFKFEEFKQANTKQLQKMQNQIKKLKAQMDALNLKNKKVQSTLKQNINQAKQRQRQIEQLKKKINQLTHKKNQAQQNLKKQNLTSQKLLQEKQNKIIELEIKSNQQSIKNKEVLSNFQKSKLENSKQLKQSQNRIQSLELQVEKLKLISDQVGRLKQQSALSRLGMFFNNDILSLEKTMKSFIINALEKQVGSRVINTHLLYKYDQQSKIVFHKYIDGHSNLFLLLKTKQGKYMAGFTEDKLQKNHTITKKGLLMSLKPQEEGQCKYFKEFSKTKSKSIQYEQFSVIFGSNQLRLKSNFAKIQSKIGNVNKYFDTGKQNVKTLFGMQLGVQSALIDTYEFYRIDFEK